MNSSRRQDHTPPEDSQLLDALMDMVQAVVIVLAESGTVLRINCFARALTGFSEGEMVGRCWTDIIAPGDDDKVFDEAFGECIRYRRSFSQVTAPLKMTSGERVDVEWSGRRLGTEVNQRPRALLVGRNLADIRPGEPLLLDAQRHKDKVTLARGVLFELSYPLTTLLGWGRILLHDAQADGWHQDTVKLICDEIERVSKMVHGLHGQLHDRPHKGII